MAAKSSWERSRGWDSRAAGFSLPSGAGGTAGKELQTGGVGVSMVCLVSAGATGMDGGGSEPLSGKAEVNVSKIS